MAALALLFAIHTYAPSPFFVLDEVDAALDVANTLRLANYVREKAGPGMQFVVISLKAGLFQESETLVGVMRDQGVNSSRALTLDVSFIIRSLCRDFIGSIFADFDHSCVNTRLSKYPIVQASRHYCTVNVPGFRELRAVLPGVSEKDVKVTVQNNHLILEGERKAPEGFTKDAFTQLAYGKFYSAWTLPNGLDLDHVNCHLQNGILEIRVPILEASKPKQIRINSGSEHKAISA